MQYNKFNTTALLVLLTGYQYFSDSPFGSPHQLTIVFSSVRCTGNEAKKITDCATNNNLTFEEGKKLINHIDHIRVAGVSCKHHCPAPTSSACLLVSPLTVISTQFVTKTVTVPCSRTIDKIHPSQQAQSASSSADSGHQLITTFLLAGISGTLATVTISLVVW